MPHHVFRKFSSRCLLFGIALVLAACNRLPPTPESLPPPLSPKISSTPQIPTPRFALPTVTVVLPTSTEAPQGRTFQVTSVADSGPATLRQALLDAEPGDVINFDPAIFPPDAPTTIALDSGLPDITQGNLAIDASDAGVILDGINLPRDTWIAGVNILSDGNVIRGLQIVNFTGAGIVVALHGRNNTIGGDRSIGRGPIGQGNLSSGNSDGIGIWDFASGNVVTGNLVGTDITGTQPMGNPGFGVGVIEGAAQNTIGPDNIIAFNGCGIRVKGSDSSGNMATRNQIFDNVESGICLASGGNGALRAPVIFDFSLADGLVSGAACANCTVEIFSDNVDEGAFYEGQAIADGTGMFTFQKGSPFIGAHLTATATDTNENTSEFSPPTSGTIRSLVLQKGNELPKIPLSPRTSQELQDNHTGVHYEGYDR